MAVIPFVRTIIFSLISLCSLGVLGICAYWASLGAGGTANTVFIPLGITAACLSVVFLPLFLGLGSIRTRRFFTSMILFEIIWFFLLWLLWVATAGTSVATDIISCIDVYTVDGEPNPADSPGCAMLTTVEALSFLSFFCAFVYYDVIFLYAIINAIRGRSVWTMSVKEASNGAAPGVIVPMGQPLYPAPVPYGTYPPNVPPGQPYNAYPQQVPPQPLSAQPYNLYPQQVPPQGAPDPQYNAYAPQHSPPMVQNQPYNYPPPPGSAQQQVNYVGYNTVSPTGNNPSLPPQPNYNAHPVHGSQAPLPLPTGYQV